MSESTKVKADIVGYTDEYAATVRSWVESEETYHNVCRGKGFPPPENVVETWQRPGVTSYILLSERKPVAYGELWDKPQSLAVEVAHLLVDPMLRSKGFGTKMLNLLYDRAAGRKGVSQVLINLFGGTEEALSCYLKAGFELTGTSAHSAGLKMVRVVE